MRSSSIGWCIRILVAVAFALPLSAEAAPTQGIKVAKANCVYVVDGVVLPLRGFRYEQGLFRCAAEVRVDGKAKDAVVNLVVRLLQKPEQAQDKEERGQTERKLELWPGFKGQVEVELKVPEAFNGCMPFSLAVELGGQVRKVQASPTCED